MIQLGMVMIMQSFIIEADSVQEVLLAITQPCHLEDFSISLTELW
jgi:hypothetical protein